MVTQPVVTRFPAVRAKSVCALAAFAGRGTHPFPPLSYSDIRGCPDTSHGINGLRNTLTLLACLRWQNSWVQRLRQKTVWRGCSEQIEVRDRSELTKRCEHFLLFGKQLVQDVVDGPVQVLYATSHARWSCPGQYADCIVQFVVFAQSFP